MRLFGSEPPPEYNVLRDEIAEKNGVLEQIHRAFAGETVRLPPVWYDPRELQQVKMEEGKRVAMVATFFPIFDRDKKVTHVAITFEDLTAELTARQAAESERERFLAILDQLPESVFIVDIDMRIVFVNGVARALGLRPGVFVADHLPLLEPQHADGTPCTFDDLPTVRVLRGGEPVLSEELSLRIGDRRVPTLVNAAPRRDRDGRVVEAILVFQDITERKEAEARIQRLSVQKDEFISVASHELRTPLTIVKATIQSAERKLRPEAPGRAGVAAALDLIARASQQTDRMARLINELLDVSAIEAGRLELRLGEHELGALVERVVATAGPTLVGRAVVVEHDQPVVADVDDDRLEQVLTNLLVNSARYSQPDRAITVSVSRRGREATIAVRDHGVGIAEAELPKIFARFYRGSHSDVGRFGGLGLGLYICAEIVARHGGRIEVTSTIGQGSTFTVVLPLKAPPAKTGD